jgi:hypothetical protein
VLFYFENLNVREKSVSVLTTIAFTAVARVCGSTVRLVGHDNLIIAQQVAVHLDSRFDVFSPM